jgi:DNA-binding GntR family transcriptional regulator
MTTGIYRKSGLAIRMNDKEKTYREIREGIITTRIKPGERLKEKELMDTYGIGRTPLREIAFQLRQEGLLEIIPKVGTHVTQIEIQEIRNVIEVRRWMEQLVGRLATERITAEQLTELKGIIDAVDRLTTAGSVEVDALNRYDIRFHNILYQASGNQELQEILPRLMSKMTRFWYYLGFQATEFLGHFDDLRGLLSALEKRDATGVQRALDIHLDHFVTKVKQQIL